MLGVTGVIDMADETASSEIEKFCDCYGIQWNLLPPRDKLVVIDLVLTEKHRKSLDEFKKIATEYFKEKE